MGDESKGIKWLSLNEEIGGLKARVTDLEKVQVDTHNHLLLIEIELSKLFRQTVRVGTLKEGPFPCWFCNCDPPHEYSQQHDEKCDYCNTVRPPTPAASPAPDPRYGVWAIGGVVKRWECMCKEGEWHYYGDIFYEKCHNCGLVKPPDPDPAPPRVGTWRISGYWDCNCLCPQTKPTIWRCGECGTERPPRVGEWVGLEWKCLCEIRRPYPASVDECGTCNFTRPPDPAPTKVGEWEDAGQLYWKCDCGPVFDVSAKLESCGICNTVRPPHLGEWVDEEDYWDGWKCVCAVLSPHRPGVIVCGECWVARPPFPEYQKYGKAIPGRPTMWSCDCPSNPHRNNVIRLQLQEWSFCKDCDCSRPLEMSIGLWHSWECFCSRRNQKIAECAECPDCKAKRPEGYVE